MVSEYTRAALTEHHPRFEFGRTGAMRGEPPFAKGLTTPATTCFHRGTSVRQRWRNSVTLSKFILNFWDNMAGFYLLAKIVHNLCKMRHARVAANIRLCSENAKRAGKSRPVPALCFESMGGNGLRFGGNRGHLHRFGPATLAARPWKGHLRLGCCGDCGFQPAAIFFHGQLLRLDLLSTICSCNAAVF